MNKKVVFILIGLVALVVIAKIYAAKKSKSVAPTDIANTQQNPASPGVLSGQTNQP